VVQMLPVAGHDPRREMLGRPVGGEGRPVVVSSDRAAAWALAMHGDTSRFAAFHRIGEQLDDDGIRREVPETSPDFELPLVIRLAHVDATETEAWPLVFDLRVPLLQLARQPGLVGRTRGPLAGKPARRTSGPCVRC
jgi:hypothetical protein